MSDTTFPCLIVRSAELDLVDPRCTEIGHRAGGLAPSTVRDVLRGRGSARARAPVLTVLGLVPATTTETR